MLMCVTTNRIALPWVVSGARVLSVCLLGVALSASCRKETGDKPESTSRPTIETLDPLFVIPGHEGKIDRDYGLPLESLIAFSVRYDLGTGASTMTFLEALEGHLRALGWSSPEFTFSIPQTRASEAAAWRHPPRGEPNVRVWEQWWIRDDAVAVVHGSRLESPDGGSASPLHVRVVILRYRPAEADRMLREYEEWHGTLPTGHTDAPVPLATILPALEACSEKQSDRDAPAAVSRTPEPITVARMLSSEVQVHPPRTSLLGSNIGTEKYKDAVARTTLGELIGILVEYMSSGVVSTDEEKAGIALYASLHIRAAGVTDNELIKLAELEETWMRRLVQWYDEHGEDSVPRQKELAQYRALYRTCAAAREHLKALETEPPVVAMFGPIGRGLFHGVVAAEQIAGPSALSVSDEEVAQHREARKQWGFGDLDDKHLRLSIKNNKAGLVIDRHILQMIEAEEIELYDPDMRDRIRRRLTKRSAP